MHIDAYNLIKSFDKNIPVSLSKSFWYIKPYNNFFVNRLIATLCDRYINTSFLDKVINHVDFLGLNFYFHNKVGIKGLKNDNDRVSDLGWWLDPGKLYEVIRSIDDRYHIPIFVTENGLADSEDKYRKWWIDESIKAMNKAIESGSNIIGYLYWSLIDNFEWDKGYWPKFGLCSVDINTKDRTIRDSGRYYSKVIQSIKSEK
jgi:beta-glucosidase